MKTLYSIFLFVMLIVSSGFSQMPFFQNYFLMRKNEPVQVNIIFQDKAGFMWYGTNKGLFKFDGINKQSFTAADGLPDENVMSIAEDTAGRIWTGFKNGKLAYIEKGKIIKFEPSEGNAINEVSDILFDQKGNLWFSTYGDGLYYYTHERLYRLDENEKMPNLYIYDLAIDKKGNVWAGTDGGVAICTMKDKNVSLEILNYDNGLPDNIVKKLVPDEDGTMWIGTDNAGIINYSPATGKYNSLVQKNWPYGSITDFLITKSQIWIACSEKGLVGYDRQKKHIKLYDHKIDTDLGSVGALLEDYEGNIWTGSKSGILRTPGDYLEFIETSDEDNDANVLAITVDKKGNTWYSSRKGLYKRSIDTFGKVSIERQLIKTKYKNSTFISLYSDEEGCIWAGLYGEGVIRLNPVSGKINLLKKELRDGNVLNISGKGNEVWLATLGGSSRITIDGDRLTINNYSRKDGLSSDYIYQVFTDSRNRVWFATDGKGADMLDSTGFHHYEEGLNSKVVYGFAEDCNHHIWANVEGDGIYQFDRGKFIPLNTEINFRSNNISCLASDQSGNLVVMHDLGIDIYNIRENKLNSLGDEVGIHDKTPNLNAVTKDDQNFIYIGTDKGIIVYSDINVRRSSMPQPHIDALIVSDKNTDINQKLSFSYDENDITVHYKGFWYQNRENLNFRYKLENYNKEWTYCTNSSVSFSNLPPGEYIFRLKASDTPQFSRAKEASFSFVIRPPFWQTTGFYILSTLTIVILVYIFIRYRERKLQSDNRVLEEKNAELKKTNMELDKFVYCVSHDLRAPLSSMLGVVQISEEETKEEIQLKHLGMLKANIKKLDGFILDILNYSRNSRLEVKKEEINFREMINEITDNLKHIGKNKNKLDIRINVADPVPFTTDKHRLGVVLNNIISNAIRYQNPGAENPQVAIDVFTSSSEACITIKDNGIGIIRENHKKIFDMFYHISETSVGSGLGLYIVKETIEKLKGHIELESDPGKGTAFYIHIPNN